MQELTIEMIAQATQAVRYPLADRDLTIHQVEFDSRRIEPGALFVPLTGGATNGHDYIEAAIERGAVACLWQKDHIDAPVDQLAVIYVDDTLEAMQQLATYYRELINPIVIGITGSNGKTTTKDMTANVLTAKYVVHKTQGNYNNEIGVPYTILSMPANTEVLVCEMGMSGFGEIGALSQIVQPDIAVITLIGESHLEYLGSRAGIAQAKLEILQGAKPECTVIVPANEPLIDSEWPADAQVSRVIRVGFDESADVYAFDLEEQQNKTYFRTNLDPSVLCVIPVMGAYNVSNALIALSIAAQLNEPIEQAIFQLAQFELTANRLQWLQTPSGAQVLNDAYNASPTSMRAVLTSFAQLKGEPNQRKSVLLGDIRELGQESEMHHRGLATAIDPQAIDRVYLFGQEMAALHDELTTMYPDLWVYYEPSNHARLIDDLESTLTADDMILVKSSFGIDLLQVVSALTGVNTK